MKNVKLLVVALCTASVLSGCASDGADVNESSVTTFNVSTKGDDSSAGTVKAPFATITRARDAVRELIKEGLKKDVMVVLRGGVYHIDETIVFGLEDSAGENQTITYTNYEDEVPIISSGQRITGWKILNDAPEDLPAAAHGKVWVADVPEAKGGKWRFHVLYDGEKLLPRARSKGFTPTAECPEPVLETRWTEKDVLAYPEGVMRDWSNLEDVEILIRPTHQWLVNYLTLSSVDEAKQEAKTTVPGTYRLCKVRNKDWPETCWVENVLEALDEPGEWVLNTQQGRIYYWPESPTPGENIFAPRLRELVRIEGKNVDSVSGDVPVRGIVLDGLVFTCGDRDVWTSEDKGIQHDWEMFDKDNAAVRFRGAADCAVRNCRIRNSGGTGIRIDLYGQNIEITGNKIFNLGGTGILLCGYGPGNKDVNKGHLIFNNEIHHIGRLYLHSPAFFVWQSGENKILNNYVHDLPYDAVVLSGVRPRYYGIMDPVKWKGYKIPRGIRENMQVIRWDEVGEPKTAEEARQYAHARNNVVQDNEFHNVMEVLGDGNAIYLSCAGEGNVIRRNLIYRTGRAATEIRFDDDQEESTVAENIVFGNGIKLKHTNYILNNIIIGGGLSIRPETAVGAKVERNIIYGTGDEVSFYSTNIHSDITRAAKKLKPLLDLARPDYNLFYSENEASGKAFVDMVKEQGHEQHGLFSDPLFVDLAKGDLRLKQNSPAHELGIKQIDFDKIGLLDDPAFARLRGAGFKEAVGL